MIRVLVYLSTDFDLLRGHVSRFPLAYSLHASKHSRANDTIRTSLALQLVLRDRERMLKQRLLFLDVVGFQSCGY